MPLICYFKVLCNVNNACRSRNQNLIFCGKHIKNGFSSSRRQSTSTLSKNQIGISDYALLVMPVTAFALGMWQIQRRKWKLSLIESLEERVRALPIDMPYDLDEIRNLEYHRVKVRGRYDHSKEFYIRPRSLLEAEKKSGVLSPGPKVGTLVVTPFILSDRNLTILVNRGWVPKNKTSPKTRPEGQINNDIDLVGVVRFSEKRPPFTGKENNSNHFWTFRDVEIMSQIYDTEPIFLDADRSSTIPGGPIGGQTNVSVRNEHLNYIITWFTLSAATGYLWCRKFLHRI